MGASAISIEEYLAANYEPDMDFVDGVLEDRNVGEEPHSWLQGEIRDLLRKAGFKVVYPELRLRVSETRCRVPDLCVYMERQREAVPTVPPVLVIEILSPEDRMSRIQEKLDDYHRMGCPCVWIVDPARKRGFQSIGAALIEAQELTHPSIPSLRVTVLELF